MRKPSEYIAAAVRGLRANLMPDCSATLVHGECSATVTRVGTTSKGEDAVSDGGPIEAIRVLALSVDFPGIVKDELAHLNDETHIVTSVREDPSHTSMTVGLSDALTKYAASLTYNAGARIVPAFVEVLAHDNGPITEYTDSFAPVVVHTWTIALPRHLWNRNPPEVGAELRLDEQRLKVSKVVEHEGYFAITARSR